MRPTGPRTPPLTQYPAASSGAVAATASAAPANSLRGLPGPAVVPDPAPALLVPDPAPASPQTTSASHCAAGAAASSRPSAATASAAPGQPLPGWPPPAGVTLTRLTTTAPRKPPAATHHPAAVSPGRRCGSSVASTASPIPAVTQAGGSPGPPGLSSSNADGRSPAVGRAGDWGPAPAGEGGGGGTRGRGHGDNSTRGGRGTR